MCFDSKSSLLAWTISYSIAWYLFNRNNGIDRWSAGFIIAFSTIQLLEAGIWMTTEENKNDHTSENMNDLLTRLVLIVLVLQPFVQSYLGYKYSGSQLLGFYTLICVAMLAWAFYRIGSSEKGQFSSSRGSGGHMVWNDAKSSNSFLGPIGILYMIGLFIPLFFLPDNKGLILIAVGVITAVFSLLKAGPKEFSSYWCYSAVLYSLIALFL